MPLVIADRVRETTTTSGTGTLTLAGPYSGFQAFSVIGNGNTTYYAIIDAQNGAWEVGIGAYTTSGNTLSRATVLASSNAGSLVNFGTGTKDVILTQPARRSVLVQEGGSGLITGVAAFTANGVPYADSTSTLATSANMTFNGTRLTVADLADSGLTSGRVTYASTGGALVDSANLTFDGTNLTLGGGTANGVAYLNGSKVLTTGSALTFDGTKLTNTGSAGGVRLEIVSTSSSPEISLTSADTGTSQINFGGATTPKKGVFRYSDNSDLFVWLLNSNTEQMRLTSTGLGIGTSSPAVRLHAFTSGVSTQAFFESGTGASVIRFKDSTTTDTFAPQFGSAGNSMFWQIAGSEQMRLTSTGLGIGTSSPSYKLDVNGVIATGSGSNRGFFYNDGSKILLESSSTYPLAFSVNGSVRATLDASGNLGLGVTPSAWASTHKALQMNWSAFSTDAGNGETSVSTNAFASAGTTWNYRSTAPAARYTQDYFGKHIWYTAPSGTAGNAISFTQAMTLDASGNLSVGTTTVSSPGITVAQGTNLCFSEGSGSFVNIFRQSNSADSVFGSGVRFSSTANAFASSTASPWARSAITVGYGAIRFLTAAEATVSVGSDVTLNERARIDSSGNLLVGTTSPSFNAGSRGNITIGGSGSAIFALQTGGTAKGYVFHDGTEMTIANEANGFLRFYTNATERARIDSSGSLLVGMTSAFGKISIGQNSQFSYAQGLSLYFSGSSYWNIVNGGSNRLYFGFNGADRGYIDSSSGNYVSVSDQRLKKNIADIGYGLSSVLSLRPVSYNMNSQEDTEEKTLGFIAQEVLEVVPESVSEMMNGMYGMDKTAIIPVLVKAIQEQQALIQTLTARVAALESN
jgi:hypothetical protein